MSYKRFWGEGSFVGDWVVLDKETLQHVRVARVREGEAIELLDGKGNFWRGSLEKNGLRVKETGSVAREVPAIVLAVGLTQGGTLEDIVRQATELGVAEVVPLKSKNAAVLKEERADNKRERWARIAAEACKQCGLYWQPEIAVPLDFEDVLERTAGAQHMVAALNQKTKPWSGVDLTAVGRVVVWVGPEGGLAPEEMAALEKIGAHAVSLGPTVLRVETACVAMLACVRQRLERRA